MPIQMSAQMLTQMPARDLGEREKKRKDFTEAL